MNGDTAFFSEILSWFSYYHLLYHYKAIIPINLGHTFFLLLFFLLTTILRIPQSP